MSYFGLFFFLFLLLFPFNFFASDSTNWSNHFGSRSSYKKLISPSSNSERQFNESFPATEVESNRISEEATNFNSYQSINTTNASNQEDGNYEEQGIHPSQSMIPQTEKKENDKNQDTSGNTSVVTSNYFYSLQNRTFTQNLTSAQYVDKWLNNLLYFLIAIIFLLTLLYILRSTKAKLLRQSEKFLMIQEVKALGNRQFLAVVDYAGKKVLLGISPGRIEFLCDLPLTQNFERIFEEEKLKHPK